MNVRNTLKSNMKKSGSAPRPVFSSYSRAGHSANSSNGKVRQNLNRAGKTNESNTNKKPKLISVITKKKHISLSKLSIVFALAFAILYGAAKVVPPAISFGINIFANDLSIQAKVAKLIKLQDLSPKIYKVQDTAALKSKNPFYQAVEPGDYVLVYNTDQKVLIYRESSNIIVNMETVSNF
jgi:hypothetical protein